MQSRPIIAGLAAASAAAALTLAIILPRLAPTPALADSQAAITPAALSALAETYTIDSEHSMVVFRIKHLNVSYIYGRFNDPTGSFTLDPANPSVSSIAVDIKVANVDTDNDKRDTHLRSPDFFDAVQFPTISFKSTKVESAGTDKYKVTGNLTIHGVTKSVTATVDRIGAGEGRRGKMSGIEATFNIKRTDFGVSYMPEGVGDDVRLMVAFEGGVKSGGG